MRTAHLVRFEDGMRSAITCRKSETECSHNAGLVPSSSHTREYRRFWISDGILNTRRQYWHSAGRSWRSCPWKTSFRVLWWTVKIFTNAAWSRAYYKIVPSCNGCSPTTRKMKARITLPRRRSRILAATMLQHRTNTSCLESLKKNITNPEVD